jgi:hypothetical protein
LQVPPTIVSRRSRIIFASAIALLAAQYWFIKTYGEPYPAIIMPSFAGVGGYADGRVTFEGYEAVFIADGKEYSFPPAELLNEFPVSSHETIANHALRPLRDAPARRQPTSRLGRIRSAIFPGYEATRGPPIDGETAASLRDWLRDRSRRLLPGRAVSAVEFRWYRESHALAAVNPSSTRTPVGSLRIPLDESAR